MEKMESKKDRVDGKKKVQGAQTSKSALSNTSTYTIINSTLGRAHEYRRLRLDLMNGTQMAKKMDSKEEVHGDSEQLSKKERTSDVPEGNHNTNNTPIFISDYERRRNRMDSRESNHG